MRVICSDTNCNPNTREVLAGLALSEGSPCRFEGFDTPLYQCVKRNAKRHNTVPESVLIRMETGKRIYDGRYVKPVGGHWGKPRCVIIDLDGTVASHKGIRGPHEEDKVYLDDVRHSIVEIVNHKYEMYEKSNEFLPLHNHSEVFVFSGRHDTCKLDTIAWLEDKAKMNYHHIEMRAGDDDRNDTIVKDEMFMEHIAGKYNVEYVLDDRAQVCRLYESMGLEVINVGGFLADF